MLENSGFRRLAIKLLRALRHQFYLLRPLVRVIPVNLFATNRSSKVRRRLCGIAFDSGILQMVDIRNPARD